MINAKEARQLVETSKEVMTKRLDRIGEKIEDAAKLGKSEIVLDHALPHDEVYKVNKKDFYPAELTEVQRLLKKELEAYPLSYIVSVIEQKHDGRGGLGCMDDEPVPFSTWHIKVSW
jgi:hypothetical protein